MRISWFLDKEDGSEDVFIYTCGLRALSPKDQQELGPIERVEYGGNADELKV